MFAAISGSVRHLPPPPLVERGDVPQQRRRLQHLPRAWASAGGVYYLLATRKLSQEADAQEQLLREEGLLPAV